MSEQIGLYKFIDENGVVHILYPVTRTDAIDAVSDLPMGGHKVIELGTPTADGDAVPLGYANQNFAPAGYGYGEALRYVEGNESGLEQIFSEILATMPNRSTKQICFTCSDGTLYGKGAFYATICKDDSNYAHVYASTYNSNYTVMKSLFGGVWYPFEWFNPPMSLGVEYRTTERWNGKAVWALCVGAGSLPNNTTKSVAHGYAMKRVLRSSGVLDDATTIPYSSWGARVDLTVTPSSIIFTTNADLSTSTASVSIWYTKD